jgi:DNA-binding NarL/FixJ family response regulator
MRRGIVSLLADSEQVSLVGQAGSVESLREVLRTVAPDVVLVDRTLIWMDSRSVICSIAQKLPHVRFLQLSPYEHVGGDKGGLDLLHDDAEHLIKAIVSAARNETTTHPGWIETVRYDSLTGRENEVLLLAAEGYTSGQIARRLSISTRTVELHRFRMSRKLGLHSPLELAKFAIRQGLVPI